MDSGTVKWFDNVKGFGFIEHKDGEDIFVHFSEIKGKGYKTLKARQKVIFDLVAGSKGLHATNVIDDQIDDDSSLM